MIYGEMQSLENVGGAARSDALHKTESKKRC